MATLDGNIAGGMFEVSDSGAKGRFVTMSGNNASLGAGAGTMMFKKMARDSFCAPGQGYVTWITSDPAGTYGGALPCGGALVDEQILAAWQP